MDKIQAINVFKQLAANFTGKYEEHVLIRQALQTIEEALEVKKDGKTKRLNEKTDTSK